MKRTPSLLVPLLFAATFCAANGAESTSAPVKPGLLGRNYLGASYVHYDFSDLDLGADGWVLEANWNVASFVDINMSYEDLRTDEFFGFRGEGQTVTAAARFFGSSSTHRPYAEVGGGWSRAEVPGIGDEEDSLLFVGAGYEFNFGSRFSLTPFISYQEYSSSLSDGSFVYGVRAQLWAGRNFALNAGFSGDDASDVIWKLGAVLRF